MVNTETQYGVKTKVRMKLPIFTGGSGFDGDRPQELGTGTFAVGGAIAGITIVCGENVCGIDPALELDARARSRRPPTWPSRSSSTSDTMRATAT